MSLLAPPSIFINRKRREEFMGRLLPVLEDWLRWEWGLYKPIPHPTSTQFVSDLVDFNKVLI